MNNHLARLLLALVLAGAAAALNYLWLQDKVPKTQEFLAFKTDVAQGSLITRASLTRIALPVQEIDPKDKGGLSYREIFVPLSEYPSVVDTKAVRNFRRGEMLQHSDMGSVDLLSEYEVLGPFRLIAVGNSFARNVSPEGSRSGGSDDSSITVAAKFSVDPQTDKPAFDTQTRRLFQLIEAAKTRTSSRASASDEKLLRIVAVAAYPKTDAIRALLQQDDAQSEPTLGLEDDELAIVVPLPNVASIPDVLLTENSPQIGFVVPAIVVRSLHASQSPSVETTEDWKDEDDED